MFNLLRAVIGAGRMVRALELMSRASRLTKRSKQSGRVVSKLPLKFKVVKLLGWKATVAKWAFIFETSKLVNEKSSTRTCEGDSSLVESVESVSTSTTVVLFESLEGVGDEIGGG